MKYTVLSASNRKGTSKKTGNKYDMHMLAVAAPGRNRTSESSEYRIAGFEIHELMCTVEVFQKALNLSYPAVLDLELEPDAVRPGTFVVVNAKSSNDKPFAGGLESVA